MQWLAVSSSDSELDNIYNVLAKPNHIDSYTAG